MSTYAAIESVVVAVLALVSVFYVLKAFMPGPLQRVRMGLANRLSRAVHAQRGNVLTSLAGRLRVDGQSSGCATGCSSGCNGCGIAARARPLPVRDDV